MDILINGNDGHLNPLEFGVVSRADDGTITMTWKPGQKKVMQWVMAHPMCVPMTHEVRYVQPDDPDWFYALPLGLHSYMKWAEPSDWPAWEKIAAEKFGYIGTGRS